jgi:hypothetical protein
MAQRKRTGSTLQSGKHANPRGKVSATPEQWARWRSHSARLGSDWATLTRAYWDSISPPLDGSEKESESTS